MGGIKIEDFGDNGKRQKADDCKTVGRCPRPSGPVGSGDGIEEYGSDGVGDSGEGGTARVEGPETPGRQKIIFIYHLIDPRYDAIRYVGQTVNPNIRISGHDKNLNDGSLKSEWINELITAGTLPSVKIAHIVYDGQEAANEIEKQEIIRFVHEGRYLLNVTHNPIMNRVTIKTKTVFVTKIQDVEPSSNSPQDVDELITINQAAVEKGIPKLTESAVWKAVQRGSLRSVLVAGHHLIHRKDLAEWNPAQDRKEQAAKAAAARWSKVKE